MRKAIITIAILLLSVSSEAQWKKVADLMGTVNGNPWAQYVTCVYFIDSPGPPRIGFTGTETGLWKTTDGGNNWNSVWGNGIVYGNYYVTDISFKDRLIGWFSIFGDTDACYRTTDGGDTWTELQVPGSTYGAEALCYVLATNRLFLSMANYQPMEVSTDLGDTWQIAVPYQTFGFSFSSPLNGIVSAGVDSIGGNLITSDGGLTWDTAKTISSFEEPLAISGSSTCFESDWGRIIIRRSDDYGRTWRVLKDFGPFQDSQSNHIAPYGTGVIRGDLSRLYIQTDSGMYVSTDEGLTWGNNGGPVYSGAALTDYFFVGKGIAIAGMIYSDGFALGNGLWEEDTAAAGVAEQQRMPSQSGTLEVFDLLGRCVYRGASEKQPLLPPGAYFQCEAGVVRKIFTP